MTTPVLIDGFEYGVTPVTSGGGIANTVTGSPTITAAAARTGNYGLRIYVTGTAATQNVTRNISGTTYGVATFYIKIVSWPSADTNIFTFGAAIGYSLRLNATDHKLYPRIGSTNGTASGALSLDTWYRIDIKAYCGSTTGTIDFQVDGTGPAQHSLSPISASSFTYIQYGYMVAATGEMYFDDLVLSATDTDYPIGPEAVEPLLPESDGTHSNAANVMEDNSGNDIDGSTYFAYSLVNEQPINDTVDYLRQATNGTGNYAEVNFADTTNSSIAGAMVYLCYRAATATADNGGCVVIDEDATATTIWGAPGALADYSESSAFYKSVRLPVPSGGWDKEAVNALIGRMGYSGDTNPNPWWLGLLVQVCYTASNTLTVSETQATTVGEAVTVTLPNAETVDLTQGVTVADLPTVTVSALPAQTVSVFDGTTLGEVVAVTMPNALAINITQGVTVGEVVSAVNPNAETVSVTQGVTVGEAITPALGNEVISTTQAVTVGEDRTVSMPNALVISTTQAVTVGEDKNAAISSLPVQTIDVKEDATVGEVVSAAHANPETVSVEQAVTVGEAVAALLPNALAVNAVQAVTVGEDAPTVEIPSVGISTVSVKEDVTVGETVTAAMANPLGVSTIQAVSVGEAVAAVLPNAERVSTTQAVSVGESVAATLPSALGVGTTQAVTVADLPTVAVQNATPRTVNVTDSATVGEAVTLTDSAPQVSTTQAVTVGETVAASLPNVLGVSVTDSVTVADLPTVSVQAETTISVNVTDSVATGEAVAATTSAPQVSVIDAITLGEPVAVLPLSIGANAVQAVTVGEARTVTLPNNLQVTVLETLTVGESLTVVLPNAERVSTTQGVTVAEVVTVTLQSPTALGISVTQPVTIAEVVTVREPNTLKVSTTQAVTVGEAYVSYISDRGIYVINITEAVTVGEVKAAVVWDGIEVLGLILQNEHAAYMVTLLDRLVTNLAIPTPTLPYGVVLGDRLVNYLETQEHPATQVEVIAKEDV